MHMQPGLPADAGVALAGFPADDQWRPLALVVMGVAELASMGPPRADATFEEATRVARQAAIAQGTAATALCPPPSRTPPKAAAPPITKPRRLTMGLSRCVPRQVG